MTTLLVLLLAVGISSVASRQVNFYRRDYTYVPEYDAYYKFHWDVNGVNWSSTFLTCDDEGAQLFYPKTRDEWTVVKKLVNALPSAPNVSEIFVGIHDKFGVGEFITINGNPTSAPILNLVGATVGDDRCVAMDVETGMLEATECFADPGTTKPFVCKKVEDVSCPTIDKGYRYFKETRKCYKLNNKQMDWSKSMETCFMEGGVLVVLESELEADIVRQKLLNSDDTNIYYAGFKRIFSNEDYYTVKGHKLSDTGYERWYSRDRNYEDQETRDKRRCGVIRDESRDMLDSVACDNKLPFVCEMNVIV